MLDKHEKNLRELKDPALSALLRDALADDPMLLESPGRTDRIMRKVLTSGVRPAPRASIWAPFAWATGAFATAAAVVFVALTLARVPQTDNSQMAKDPVNAVQHATQSANAQPPDQELTRTTLSEVKTPQVKEKPVPRWIEETPQIATQDDQPVEAPQPDDSVQVAAALYDAGSTAHSVGDYETAYEAYQASYEASPTADALLASGRALEQLALEALNQDESSSS